MTFETVRKGWHRKQLADGQFVHVIKTGAACWRIARNTERSRYPGTVAGTQFTGWAPTVKEALAKAA